MLLVKGAEPFPVSIICHGRAILEICSRHRELGRIDPDYGVDRFRKGEDEPKDAHEADSESVLLNADPVHRFDAQRTKLTGACRRAPKDARRTRVRLSEWLGVVNLERETSRLYEDGISANAVYCVALVTRVIVIDLH